MAKPDEDVAGPTEGQEETSPLDAAQKWIFARGGPGQVAEDVLKMTLGDHGYGACGPALEKAGAPGGTYSLINRELWQRRNIPLDGGGGGKAR